MTHKTAIAAVLAAAVLWGVSGVVARSLFQHAVDPTLLVHVRMLLGGLLLVPLALRGARPRPTPPAGLLLVFYGGALTAVQLTYFFAIRESGVAVAIFLQYTAPVLVAAWEAAAARSRPSSRVSLALALAMIGSALLVLGGGAALRVSRAGVLWGLGAAVAMAAGTVLGGLAPRVGLRAERLLCGGLLVGALGFSVQRSPASALGAVAARDWPYFLFIAVFATAIPFALYLGALRRLRGSVAILLAMLEPVVAAGLAWIALGEALAPAQLLGGGFILGAVLLLARS